MIGSLNMKVNINLRRLAIRLLAGSSAVVLLSAATLSETKAAAHVLTADHASVAAVNVAVVHHSDAVHTAEAIVANETVASDETLGGDDAAITHASVMHAARAAHVEDVGDLHVVTIHAPVAVQTHGDRLLVLHAVSASHVLNHVARLVMSHADGDFSISMGVDMDYVRRATGIDLFGAPKDWHSFAARYGYYVSDKPVPGGVVCFEGGAYGASEAYGFAGVVIYYQDRGDHWEVGTRFAYLAEGRSYYDDSYVKEQVFQVFKNDPRAHFIYRGGMNLRTGGYYTRPEYVGHNVVGEYHAFSGDAKDVVAVYPKSNYERAFVRAGQVVRVLAKAEVGETLWVFIETPYRAGTVYAVTHYGGGERLMQFDASSPEAARMYFAKDYGDTVLDLGYADYSRIAGDSGEVTITIKKGGDPARLLPLQTVRLQLDRKGF